MIVPGRQKTLLSFECLFQQCFDLRGRLFQGISNLFPEQRQRLCQVGHITWPQVLLSLDPAQFLGDLCILERVAAFDRSLVLIGSSLGLWLGLTIPGFDLLQ